MTRPLKYRNNWEADEYYVGGIKDAKLVKTLKRVRIGDKEYPVTKRRVTIPYSDMGHTYHGTSDHYFIKEKVFGLTIEFDLNKIVPKQAVFPVVFTTE